MSVGTNLRIIRQTAWLYDRKNEKTKRGIEYKSLYSQGKTSHNLYYQKMTPEEKARLKIDQWFADAGWKVINRDDYEPTCTAVAIREGLLKGNLEADYFLFINGKAIGVLEA